jgi:hypothetical protein
MFKDPTTKIAGFEFRSIVGGPSTCAKLSITFLRPEVPGRLVLKGGDIDNRIKTLLDALCIPPENQIPKKTTPTTDETPFYCLLKDDSFVVGLDIDTDRLLKPIPASDPTYAFLLIKVSTRALPTALYPSILHLP